METKRNILPKRRNEIKQNTEAALEKCTIIFEFSQMLKDKRRMGKRKRRHYKISIVINISIAFVSNVVPLLIIMLMINRDNHDMMVIKIF